MNNKMCTFQYKHEKSNILEYFSSKISGEFLKLLIITYLVFLFKMSLICKILILLRCLDSS